MKRTLVTFLVLCLPLFATAGPGLAQEKEIAGDLLSQMLSEGWKIVQDGVLQRELRAGEVESFVFDTPGFTWKLRDLQRQLQSLQKAFRADPSPELRRAIANHRKEIANTRKVIELARAAEASEAETGKVSCSINFGYNASASYLTSSQGTFGNASANFSSNCAFSGEVYAYALATVTVNGAPTTWTVTDGPRSGSSVTASAYASLNGVSPCESYAYASMTSNSLNPSSYSMAASNSSCPVANLDVTISGPGYVGLDYGQCATLTWTAAVTGGTPAYNYQWKFNGTVVGTNSSSYSRSFCGGSFYSYTTNTVSVTVTDSIGASDTASKSVVVEKFGGGIDDCGGTTGKICP